MNAPVTFNACSVAIDLVRTDGGTQSRAQLYANVVTDYIDALGQGAKFPPIVVFFDGTDYWLADGFHRHAAYMGLGKAEIPADVRQGTRRDAILHSVGANSAHGLRRTQEDKRRAVTVLLSDPEWSTWSDREIARQCGVDGKTVAKHRAEVTAEIRSEEPRKYINKHGNTATMDTTRIGGEQRRFRNEYEDQEGRRHLPPPPLGDPEPEYRPASQRRMDPRALWLWGRLKDFEREGILSSAPEKLLAEMTEPMRADVRRLLPLVRGFIEEMEVRA